MLVVFGALVVTGCTPSRLPVIARAGYLDNPLVFGRLVRVGDTQGSSNGTSELPVVLSASEHTESNGIGRLIRTTFATPDLLPTALVERLTGYARPPFLKSMVITLPRLHIGYEKRVLNEKQFLKTRETNETLTQSFDVQLPSTPRIEAKR
jgi:hypothetical protein